MRRVILDKIGSVTLNCGLSREVRLGEEFPCKEGDVVAVRVKTRKTTYNELELTTGRFSQLKPGDVIAGALGHRRALLGYAGHIPKSLAVGEPINILNLGGVLGICTSHNPSVGPPFECEVLGQVQHFPYLGERIGIPANIGQNVKKPVPTLNLKGVPVVAVVGTCMNAGKTYACSALIQECARRGYRVAAAKATGVSLRRDVLAMEDAGAVRTMMFTDLGIVTTKADNAPWLTRSMLSYLAEESPDLIVLELGDGLMGDYGVDAILADPELSQGFSAVMLAANDPVGVFGGIQILKERYAINTTVITGPATDNAAGTDLIKTRLSHEAFNARTSAAALAELILGTIGLTNLKGEPA